MIIDFLTSNREELIDRCRAKVAKRFAPSQPPPVFDHGVPLFLRQLEETFRLQPVASAPADSDSEKLPSATMIGRAAAVHGAELLRLGFTIDQVVHEYGDVCQSVTELAAEDHVLLSTDEFRTLNGCLDDAIADAVTSFSVAQQTLVDGQVQDLHAGFEHFSDEHRRLVDIASRAFDAIKTGSVGLSGATGTLLFHTLGELRSLPERMLPKISA
jgi:hypothetical protein